MKICLLIINYNGYAYLKKYLFEISQQCLKNDITLVVTDDQSKDESIILLQENNIKYTINNSNKHGFASNVNNGIKFANNFDNYDYFIISNNDISIREGMFDKMKDVLFHLSHLDNNIGLIGFDEIEVKNYNYFDTFDFRNYNYDRIKKSNKIPGFFFLISNKLINTIGYFDEDYFMYGEENDSFIRTLKARFSIYNSFLPVMHYSEGSSTNLKLTSWYVYRNAFLFAQKNLSTLGIIKMFVSFIYIIYNPFYSNTSPSSLRIRRNGFIYNNYLLMKSIIWNINFYFKNIK